MAKRNDESDAIRKAAAQLRRENFRRHLRAAKEAAEEASRELTKLELLHELNER